LPPLLHQVRCWYQPLTPNISTANTMAPSHGSQVLGPREPAAAWQQP
jgi:hypothetical protein